MPRPDPGKISRTSRSRRTGRPRPQRRPAGPWKHGPVPVLGVVGGIGSGKSAVAACLAGHGAFVLDADAVGHALLDQRPVREAVVSRFGPDVLTEDEDGRPRVDRRVLGPRVFADLASRRDLEAVLHPRMRRTFERAIAREARRGRATAVVIDAAVLYEAGWDDLCDRVVFVDAPRERRLERVAAGRGWTDEDLSTREAAQWPLDSKRERADFVVSNTGDLAALKAETDRAWSTLRRPVRAGVRATAPRRLPDRPPGPGGPTSPGQGSGT